MLNYIARVTADYIEHMPKEQRKKYGQFFTSAETARFMVSLFNIPVQEKISVLDPGAGSGILSAALIERMQTVDTIKEIHLTCYENNANVLPLLRENLAWLVNNSKVKVAYNIKTDNYILSQADAYKAGLNNGKFDLIIGNPPYKKVCKTAPEVTVMPDVCYGTPNLYFLFAIMSLFNLREGEKWSTLFLVLGLLEPISKDFGRSSSGMESWSISTCLPTVARYSIGKASCRKQ